MKSTQILLLSVIFLLSACNNENTTLSEENQNSTTNQDYLVGSWKDNSKSALHFTLFKDGSARSDNMETLLYKTWKVKGSQLTLTVESVGNGTSSTNEVNYTINKLTKNQLVLKNRNLLSKYTKE